MNLQRFRLLFHHHDLAYQDADGQLWMSAGIGRWVSALAAHFQEIGLLVHVSASRAPRQDAPITAPNVRLVSLGPPATARSFVARARRIRQACRQAGEHYDGLLIRGLTPRQYPVWRQTPVRHKAFLLVRSPAQDRFTHFSPGVLVSAFVNAVREYEFRRIARNETLMLANSPVHLPEIEHIAGRPAFFVPTNTLRSAEVAEFHLREPGQPVRLMFCGRLSHLKGLRELFQAAALLQQQGIPLQLELVGTGEPAALAEFRNLGQQLGLSGDITWRGQLPFGPDLLAAYRLADVFILPTYTEGFPRVLWEAASQCCPIISTTVGGIPALMQHNEHALLVPPRDAPAIAQAVRTLLSQPGLRRAIITNAYRLVQEYTVESCAQRMATTLASQWSSHA